MHAAYKTACERLLTAATRWTALNGAELTALNATLTGKGLQPVPAAAGVKAPACGP